MPSVACVHARRGARLPVRRKVYHVNASRSDTTSASRAFGCGAEIAARLAAASCAAGYAWGEDGSNQCPTSYFAIVNAVACETAATAAGKAYFGSVTVPSYPSGCFYFYQGDDGFYFNADAVGAGEPGTQLLCSGAARSRTAGSSIARVDDCSSLGYSQGTIGYSRAIGVLMGYYGVLMGYYGALKYPASGLKEALERGTRLDAHGLSAWARERP
jgi:hypothetical protein